MFEIYLKLLFIVPFFLQLGLEIFPNPILYVPSSSLRGGGAAGPAGFLCSLGPLSVFACPHHGEDVGLSPAGHAPDMGSDRRDGPDTD